MALLKTELWGAVVYRNRFMQVRYLLNRITVCTCVTLLETAGGIILYIKKNKNMVFELAGDIKTNLVTLLETERYNVIL